MTPDQHRTALQKIAAERERITEAEPAAIVAALKAGLKQAEVVKAVGRTREHVRRVARAHGID